MPSIVLAFYGLVVQPIARRRVSRFDPWMTKTWRRRAFGVLPSLLIVGIGGGLVLTLDYPRALRQYQFILMAVGLILVFLSIAAPAQPFGSGLKAARRGCNSFFAAYNTGGAIFIAIFQAIVVNQAIAGLPEGLRANSTEIFTHSHIEWGDNRNHFRQAVIPALNRGFRYGFLTMAVPAILAVVLGNLLFPCWLILWRQRKKMVDDVFIKPNPGAGIAQGPPNRQGHHDGKSQIGSSPEKDSDQPSGPASYPYSAATNHSPWLHHVTELPGEIFPQQPSSFSPSSFSP